MLQITHHNSFPWIFLFFVLHYTMKMIILGLNVIRCFYLYLKSWFFLQCSRYSSTMDVTDAINQLAKRVARTRSFNLPRMLRTIREKMFTSANGDRDGVPNGVILVTDTTANQPRAAISAEADQMKAACIGVYTVGVGLSDKSQLEMAAVDTNNIHTVSDYAELERNGDSVRRSIQACE